MRDLRNQLIRLAHRKPHLRAHVLPLLSNLRATVSRSASYRRIASGDFFQDWAGFVFKDFAESYPTVVKLGQDAINDLNYDVGRFSDAVRESRHIDAAISEQFDFYAEEARILVNRLYEVWRMDGDVWSGDGTDDDEGSDMAIRIEELKDIVDSRLPSSGEGFEVPLEDLHQSLIDFIADIANVDPKDSKSFGELGGILKEIKKLWEADSKIQDELIHGRSAILELSETIVNELQMYREIIIKDLNKKELREFEKNFGESIRDLEAVDMSW